MQDISMNITSWLKESVLGAGADGVVFGLSGGVDSAVVGALCKKAFGDNAVGIIMPCRSNPQDQVDAQKVATSLGIRYKVVNLDKTFEEFISASGDCQNMMAKANVKPRLRMATLYYHAALYDYLVVGSENRSEWHIGYFTKYGDSGVDLMPLVGLVKSQIWSLAEHLGVPQDIIDKVPTAGLWIGQTDEDEMGFGYDELDAYILEGKTSSSEIKAKIHRLHENSKHKRRLPLFFNF